MTISPVKDTIDNLLREGVLIAYDRSFGFAVTYRQTRNMFQAWFVDPNTGDLDLIEQTMHSVFAPNDMRSIFNAGREFLRFLVEEEDPDAP